MYKFGIIGTGKMGSALAKAITKKEKSVILANRTPEKAQALAEKTGADFGDVTDVAENAKYIFLGVKPQNAAELIDGIKLAVKNRTDRCIIVTMLAGTTTDKICEMFGFDLPVIRIMPNTPAEIGMGTTVYCANGEVSTEEKDEFAEAMEHSGILTEIAENMMDAACAVSGCGPAFVYMFAGAMADGAVKCGLPRNLAVKLAAETVIGSASMIAETKKNPDSLKEDVCSPGGTTIEGVYALEKGGMRAAVMEAVEAAYRKSKNM